MKSRSVFVIAALFAGTVFAADQSADQAKVEAALKAHGYTSWKSIVLDKGVYEVDDAKTAAGKQYDLRIDAATLKIKSKTAE
jgi:hypothetical protein